jgi:hypothetical protein
VKPSTGIYSVEESFDDELLDRLLPESERDGWLFRVNTHGPDKSGSLSPLAPAQIQSQIGIENEA